MASLATFPGSAIAVTIVWKFGDAIFGIDHRALPIVTSFLIALALYAVAYTNASSRAEKIVGFGIAAVNGMYLALSVLGIDIGLGQAGVTNQIGGEVG